MAVLPAQHFRHAVGLDVEMEMEPAETERHRGRAPEALFERLVLREEARIGEGGVIAVRSVEIRREEIAEPGQEFRGPLFAVVPEMDGWRLHIPVGVSDRWSVGFAVERRRESSPRASAREAVRNRTRLLHPEGSAR